MLIHCFTPSIADGIFIHGINLYRLFYPFRNLKFMVLRLLRSNYFIRRPRDTRRVHLYALLPCSIAAAAIFSSGQDNQIMVSRQDVQTRTIQHCLNLVTSKQSAHSFCIGTGDSFCNETGRVTVVPDSSNHPDRPNLVQ